MSRRRTLSTAGILAAALIAGGWAFQAITSTAEAAPPQWSYLEALRFFRAGGSISPASWQTMLTENDQVSINALTLAQSVAKIPLDRSTEPGIHGVSQTQDRVVIEPTKSTVLTQEPGMSDYVVYVYDTPVIVSCSLKSGPDAERANLRLDVGEVALVSGSAIQVRNESETRTATIYFERVAPASEAMPQSGK